MDLLKVKPGSNPPHDLNVLIEIPSNSSPIKYEYDKDIGGLVVDRIQANSMFYPCNYGFVPNTLSEDGDPLDVLVVSRYPIMPGAIVNVRPVGVLDMEDDGGVDYKIIAVPSDSVCKFYSKVHDIEDVEEVLKKEIYFFFSRYKDVQDGKWTKVGDFKGKEEAQKIIEESISNFKG
ncbi:inorganic diphosphatase [Rickettsiales bacterium]|nr:inorganic diphosphatase [Rickettsiales bacterium]